MMNGPYLVLAVLAGYFALLVAVARWAARRHEGNDQFFTGGRQTPRWLVSF